LTFEATDRMWAIDGGMKWRGFAINGQYYFLWLNGFEADGPLPLTSTFDHGGEFSASYNEACTSGIRSV
jgi:hypothetical protein